MYARRRFISLFCGRQKIIVDSKSKSVAVIDKMVDLAERLAVATLTGLLSLSAVGIFLWMAAWQWSDTAGTTVGVILIVMASCQLAGSAVWFRLQRSRSTLSVDGRKREYDVVERQL